MFSCWRFFFALTFAFFFHAWCTVQEKDALVKLLQDAMAESVAPSDDDSAPGKLNAFSKFGKFKEFSLLYYSAPGKLTAEESCATSDKFSPPMMIRLSVSLLLSV